MLLFLATLLAFRILSAVLSRVVRRAVNSFGNTPELLGKFFVNMVRRITMFIGIVVALSMLGLDIGPLVAGIGAAGLVLGFALQGTLSNFASGIMILMHRPYDIGNYVKVAGVAGTVNAMNLVSTSLRTSDNQTVVVPNNAIWSDIITNVSANSTRRVDLTFGIGYSDDIGKAHRVLASLLEDHPLVLKDPEPNIQVSELANSSVNIICRPWCKAEDYWTIYWGLQRQVKERFDQEGISIPFPQQDVHMHQAAPA
jgi:small conductance mechanosensitive channel